MNRNEVMEALAISDNTFRKWCKAHDISTTKAEYSDEDIAKLEHCQKAMADKMTWNDYLISIGKASKHLASSGLVQRYLPGRQDAKSIAQSVWTALDAMVAEEFVSEAKNPSPIFSRLLQGLKGQDIITQSLGDSDALYYLEGEILDAE